MKRYGAVDYGRRWIGLAVSDPLGITVRGLETLRRGDDMADAARQVGAALAAEGVEAVVIGLALHMDGRESDMSRETRRFAARLAEVLPVPQHLHDEGLTTFEAEERVRARGVPLREAKRTGKLDREAACALLRGWIQDVPNQ